MTFSRIGLAVNPQVSIQHVDTVQQSGKLDLEQVQKSQDKLKFALVDSGMGGGMTAAFLRGEVRQLGSYFCLPIGEKPGKIATGYTAAMALWPLIAPLSDRSGKIDGRVAENVIIACNSASVRRDGAIELMKMFCEGVATGRLDGMQLNPTIKNNIVALHEQIQSEPNYLENRVKEIVTETAKAGVRSVEKRLAEHPSAFVRIDSTNGTAQSKAYPDRIATELQGIADGGEVARQTFPNTVSEGGVDYTINHDVFTFKVNGEPKVVVVESRGNPPWVPDIEGNKVGTTGPELVAASGRASGTAIGQLLENPAFTEFTKDHGGERLAQVLSGNKPDLSMLCCTHYPAMKESLESSYGEGVEFINQATIVRDIATSIDQDVEDPGRGDLHLALTVGSQNYGGTPGNLKPSISDGNATAKTLFNVLDMTLQSSGLPVLTGFGSGQLGNDLRAVGSVQVFEQGLPGEPSTVDPKDISSLDTKGVLQQQFELIHRFIAQPFKVEILAEQHLEEVPNAKSDEPKLRLMESGKSLQVHPTLTEGGRQQEIMEGFSENLSKRLDRLGELTTLGESRGIDKLAPYNAQGEQLRAAASQMIAMTERNEGKPLHEKERVGILTGFSVIDNPTGRRVGGENDGPPGAVIMARTLLQRGLPVTLITDQSGEASLVSALVGSGLAELSEVGKLKLPDRRTLEDLVLKEPANEGMLKFEVPKVDNRDTVLATNPKDRPSANERRRETDKPFIDKSVERLRDDNVTTVITIERPSVTQYDDGLYSMLGLDVSPFNLDMSPVLGSEGLGFKPYTIGIGDGGNELGTGGIAKITAKGRDEQLQPFVKRGDFIAARQDLATDVMLLSTVSNNGGITLAMAIDAAFEEHTEGDGLRGKIDGTIRTYNDIVGHMFEDTWNEYRNGSLQESGMSIDGVNKENLLTVDGRFLGSVGFAERRYEAYSRKGEVVPLGIGPSGKEGSIGDTTHNDTFLKFKHALLN